MNKRPRSPLSIAICAYNGLEYTKLLVESLRKHSTYEHEVLIYSDGSSDRTLEWLKTQRDIVWQHARRNLGICTAMNRVARMAKREYLFFPNTDHVLAPGWDRAMLARLAPRKVVSAQCIEPGTVPVAPIFHAENCGTRWDEFDEACFHEAAARASKASETSGVNYPFALSKALWLEVGGLDEIFNPGPANDPDLFYRLSLLGAQMVRADDVVIYHFSGKSSRMAGEARKELTEWHLLTERNEARFVEKWGERYRYANGGLPDPGPEARRRWERMRPPPSRPEVRSRLEVVLDCRTVGPNADGISAYTINLAMALARLPHGPRLRCLSGMPDHLGKAILGAENVQIESCSLVPGEGAREAALAEKITREWKSNLFHGPAFALPPGLGVPSIVTVHDLAFILFPEWYPKAFVEHLTRTLDTSVAAAGRIIAVSERTKADLLGRYPGAASRIDQIYEALPVRPDAAPDAESIERARRRYGGDRPIILSVGVQQRRKNALGLVRAFSGLRARGGLIPRLVLVGGEECEEPRLRDEVASLGLSDDVVLTGRLAEAEIGALYATASAFVYPSLYEGFGFPPLEAMAARVPVIVSDRGALPEVAGDAALVVSPTDSDGMTNALFRILSDHELRETLIANGTRRLEKLSWQFTALETLKSYKRAIKDHRRPEEVRLPPDEGSLRSPRHERPRRQRRRIAVDARLLGLRKLGTGRYTEEILHGLLRCSGDAEFILIGPEKLDPDLFRKSPRILDHLTVGCDTLLDPAWEQFALPTHLLGCDLLFSPTGISPVTKPCKTIPVIHDLGFMDHPEHFEPRLRSHLSTWIRNACLSADRVISVSQFTKDRLCALYGLPQDRIRVVHHGRPRRAGSPRPEENLCQGRGAPESYVLCVSSFEPNKNLSILVRAFECVSREWPGKLVLAGRSGRDLEAVKKLVGELSLADRVLLRVDPSEEDIDALYRSASLFAFPSLYEGFGLPLVEAMAAGLPVVAGAIPASLEVLGDAGRMVSEKSPDGWAVAMIEVLRDRGLAHRLSTAAVDRSKIYDWQRSAEETWNVMLECMESR